jgi:hypothetical protein
MDAERGEFDDEFDAVGINRRRDIGDSVEDCDLDSHS